MIVNAIDKLQQSIQNVKRPKVRVLVIGILVTIALIYFIFPKSYHGSTKGGYTLQGSVVDACIERQLVAFRSQINNLEAIVRHIPAHDDDPKFLPFVGDGYIGLSVGGPREGIFIKDKREFNMAAELNPIVSPSIDSFHYKGATVMSLTSGEVIRFRAFQTADAPAGSECVLVEQRFFAHRAHRGALVQTLHVHNPTSGPVTVRLDQNQLSSWSSNVEKLSTGDALAGSETLSGSPVLGSKHVLAPKDSSQQPGSSVRLSLSIIQTQLVRHHTLTLQATSETQLQFLTLVQYEEQSMGDSPSSLAKENILNTWKELRSHSINQLRVNHTKVWASIWECGFSISQSLAPGHPNGDHINTTLYYVLSSVQSSAHIANSAHLSHTALASPESCFDGHSTLHSEALWPANLLSESDVSSTVHRWLLTLLHSGCSNLVNSGAEGTMQALTLSLASLKFKSGAASGVTHLEFTADPSELHRDALARNVMYGLKGVHVNVSVTVGEDNRPFVRVSLEGQRRGEEYYGCDAGCIDPPVKLSTEPRWFAVKRTDPPTALLYITHDAEHINELKHTIHVKELDLAPAHDHRLMSLHRHGHSYGGLPAIFWVLLAVLIVVFHLFLFKMIYNEYCAPGMDSQYRRRALS